MPRGNDSEAAASELADRFGQGAGNAEELIQAHDRERSRELVAASMKEVDAEATEELDISKLEGPNGEEVLSASVRGGAIVGVYEDENGRTHKRILKESKKDGSKQEAKRSARSKSRKPEGDSESAKAKD